MVAPFRIEKPRSRPLAPIPESLPGAAAAPVAPGPPAPGGDDAGQALKGYVDRLLKLVPTEIISLYLAGAGFLRPITPDLPERQRIFWAGWAAFCLVAVLVVRTAGTADKGQVPRVQWPVVLISMAAFVVWVYTLGGPFLAFGLYDPTLGALMVLAFTFLAPYLYHGS